LGCRKFWTPSSEPVHVASVRQSSRFTTAATPGRNPAQPLARVNTAGVAVVLVTIALAVAAAVGAARASRQSQLARDANERGREELWKSYLAQAHAGRLSRVVGSRAAGLEAITAAAAIRPSVELRNEAIAHLAMLDFEPTSLAWTNVPNHRPFTIVDQTLERFLESDGVGNIRISQHPQPDERLPPARHQRHHPFRVVLGRRTSSLRRSLESPSRRLESRRTHERLFAPRRHLGAILSTTRPLARLDER
jgi:hypothetical protein